MAGEYFRECPQLSIKCEFAVALVLDRCGDSLLVVGLVRYGCTDKIAVTNRTLIIGTIEQCEMKGVLATGIEIRGTHHHFVMLGK